MNIKEILEYLDGQGIIITESDGEIQDALEEIGYSLFSQLEDSDLISEEE